MHPGKKAANWIEQFCVVPHGINKGQHAMLTVDQKGNRPHNFRQRQCTR